jgi:acetyl esterase/lipase
MGSSYFYLEFLLAFVSLLCDSGFRNPAVLALEYTLVPDASYPTQIHQAIAGYKYIISIIQDPSKICVSGDSAGGSIILSLLLHLATAGRAREAGAADGLPVNGKEIRIPGMAALISPWATLVSRLDKNTLSDYLDAASLHLYAHQYAGSKVSVSDPLISPGNCKDAELWRRASPSKGIFVTYGKEEVFAPEIRGLVSLMKHAGLNVESREEEGGIHAWPVASLFLSSTKEQRQRGLKIIIERIRAQMD